MAYASAILIVILLLIVGLAVLWRLSLLHLNGASRSFHGAIREWEQELGVHDRYETPWLLMLGDEAFSTPLLKSWGLRPADKPGWYGRWWYGPDGAVLAVPEALFSHGEGASIQLKLWRQLLKLLLQARAHRPLDGVIWLHALESLQQQEPGAGQAARRKFLDLQQRLGLSLPVYLIIGGAEDQPGITELIEALPPAGRETSLGWSSTYPVNAPWHAQWITDALHTLKDSLSESIVELGALKGQVSADLYLLPERLQALSEPLQALCDPVFQGNALGEAPRFRGLYFSAAPLNNERPQDNDPFADEHDQPAPAPLFSHRLWRQRIIAEQGLAQPIRRILDLRQRWHRTVAIGAGALGILWFCGMLWAWNVRSADADRLATLLHDDQILVLNGSVDDIARKRINSLWQLLTRAPRWNFHSVALPGSWFSPLNHDLTEVLRQRARQQLFIPVQDKLFAELAALSAPRALGARGNSEASTEEYYKRATYILERGQGLESQHKRFALVLEGDLRPLDDSSALANELFGLNLQGQQLFFDAFYNHSLMRLPLPQATALSLSQAKDQVSAGYLAAMRTWLDRLFGSDGFALTAGYLNKHLRELQAGQRNSLSDLESLSEHIDQLRQLIALTNVAWSQSAGSELTPGYQAMLERSRQSALIGPQVVIQVENYADSLRRTFHDRWLERGSDQLGILRQQKGGSLELQSHVEKLDLSIEALMRQDFTQAALSHADNRANAIASLRNLDTQALDDALRYYASYQAYLQQDVTELPAYYRKAVIGAAQDATTTAMWQRLNESPPNPLQSSPLGAGQAFDLPADKALEVLHVFVALSDTGHADNLRRELNGRALSDIHRTAANVDALPLFRQPMDFNHWDGSRNLALTQYREPDQQSLKLSLNRQFKLIGDELSASRNAMDWLNTQRSHLLPSEADTLDGYLGLALDMKKYNEENPTSSPLLYEQLVNRDYNQMDIGNCATVLAAVILPQGNGKLSALAHTSREQAQQRCNNLQVGTAAQAWQQLSRYFNQYLAGRFPFAFDGTAADANPDRVREFLNLIDTHLPVAMTGLDSSYGPDSPVARDFLEHLKDARLWLGPLLQRDKEGLRGLDLEIRWRTDREDERGADQVIDWNFSAGNRNVSYPGQITSQTRWSVGEPVNLALRWAKGSSQRPISDPRQAALAVSEMQASWTYDGPWALLRFIRANQAVERFPAADNSDRPLALQLPVRSLARSDSSALMFLRLSLKPIGGQQALAMTPLPVSAPASPFGPTANPPLAGVEYLP